MKYPYIAYCRNIEIMPVFKGLTGNPLVVDLSVGSPVFDAVDITDQPAFQRWLDQTMTHQHTWGLASYLEDRETILSQYPPDAGGTTVFSSGAGYYRPPGNPALRAPWTVLSRKADMKKVLETTGAMCCCGTTARSLKPFTAFTDI